jgi:hypothetical protein
MAALMADLGGDVVAANNDLFERLIVQASSAVERYCGRIFAQQKYREILLMPPLPDRIILLSRWPIVSVTSLLLGTTAVTDYRIEVAESGLLYLTGDGWWDLESSSEWTAEYVAGYILPTQTTPPAPTGDALPGDVERATIEVCKVWFHERQPSARVQARHMMDQSITYAVSASRDGLPVLAQQLLQRGNWKRLVLR